MARGFAGQSSLSVTVRSNRFFGFSRVVGASGILAGEATLNLSKNLISTSSPSDQISRTIHGSMPKEPGSMRRVASRVSRKRAGGLVAQQSTLVLPGT